MTTSGDAINAYIATTSPMDEGLEAARADAAEFDLSVPDSATGEALKLLASLATGWSRASNEVAQCIAVTPALGVVGLHLFAGMPENGHLSCIDPDTEHQRLAKEAFRGAGYGPRRYRFLPARALDVMERLAPNSYSLIYVEAAPSDVVAIRDLALPLLNPGGVLVFPDTLLDGTIGDNTRTDRMTVAAREADAELLGTSDVTVARLPIGAGATVLHKRG